MNIFEDKGQDRGQRDTRETDQLKAEATEYRPTTYTPPKQLDLPDVVIKRFYNNGYKLRWVRFQINQEEDAKNIAERTQEGYIFVKVDEVPELRHLTRQVDKGIHQGLVTTGDLALAKVDINIANSRDKYYQNQAKAQEGAIKDQLMKHQDSKVPIYDNSRSVEKVGIGAEDFS